MSVDHLNRGTLGDAPAPCRNCMWWQTRPGMRAGDRDRWTLDAEESFGTWGKVYLDDGRVTGLIQYGPAEAFPRAQTMPAGPPSGDAALITCAFLTDARSPWVLQSLVLAAIGECKGRGFPAMEAFCHRYQAGQPMQARMVNHRTIFPIELMHDFGFQTHRQVGRIELVRLDLRGLVPAEEASVLQRIKERLAVVNPAPASVR